MAKNSGYLARQQAYRDIIIAEERHRARVYQMDLVTLALGRMGWGEKRFEKFDAVLSQVAKEYTEEILEDAKVDKDMWHSKATLDRELAQYVGKLFAPYDERYR